MGRSMGVEMERNSYKDLEQKLKLVIAENERLNAMINEKIKEADSWRNRFYGNDAMGVPTSPSRTGENTRTVYSPKFNAYQ